jgi:hypothetical protein
MVLYLRLQSPEVSEQALLAYATNLPAKLVISSQHLMMLRPQTHSPTQYQSRTLSKPRQQHERTTTYPERSSPGSPCPRGHELNGRTRQQSATQPYSSPRTTHQKGCSLKRTLKAPSLMLAWCLRRPQSHPSIRPVDYPTHRVQPSPVIIRT